MCVCVTSVYRLWLLLDFSFVEGFRLKHVGLEYAGQQIGRGLVVMVILMMVTGEVNLGQRRTVH